MNNIQAFELAKKYIPGGVNSPVRSFASVGGVPFFASHANGCYLFDIDNNQYIDYVCSWGTNIIGHANPDVVAQVQDSISRGVSFGTPTELETQLLQKINQFMPHLAKIRLVNSGTEACMSAVRLARGYTKKKLIIKFDGCYHGHSDCLLANAGSGVATFKTDFSASGVLNDITKHTLVLPYNDIDAINNAFATHGDDIACVIVEPIAGNMNFIRGNPQFLATIRELCTQYESVFIFDEVMTGFRIALGGAVEVYGIIPDMTILGKVIGGGMPLAAFGGSAKIMDYLAPSGPVYQAGTLSGNPIATTCGLATLSVIENTDNFYIQLSNIVQSLVVGVTGIAQRHGVPLVADSQGGMFGIQFGEELATNFAQVKTKNESMFKQFFKLMLEQNVFFAPSMYEAGFLCIAHDKEVIAQTLETVENTLRQL